MLSMGLSSSMFYFMILLVMNGGENMEESLVRALVFGLAMGIFYPLAMKYLYTKFADKVKIVPKLSEGEVVLQQYNANMFRGKEAVGGRIFITDCNFLFQSHSFNIQRGQSSIPLSEIAGAQTFAILKVDKGLQLKTRDGKEYKFVVEQREDLMQHLPIQ
jgi:hypothetical protein